MRIYFITTARDDWVSVLIDLFLVYVYRDLSKLNHIVIAIDGSVYDLTVNGCYSYNERDLDFSRVAFYMDVELCLLGDLTIEPITYWHFIRWFFGRKPRVCTSLVELVTGYSVGSLSPLQLKNYLEQLGYEPKEIPPA